MKFYLGTHLPYWLRDSTIPLFVSRRTLSRYKKLFQANSSWALDSGGFTELNMYGKWTISAQDYGKEVTRYHEEIGKLDFASIQDWMCEPFVLEKTGKTVKDHQKMTIDNYLELKDSFPNIPWLPVIQGFEKQEYIDHINQYEESGVNLTEFDRVGIGSVCRRQSTNEIKEIVTHIASLKIRLHGFGVKKLGLIKIANLIASADSLAWSFTARRRPPLPGCEGHKHCNNCKVFAHKWYGEICEILQNL